MDGIRYDNEDSYMTERVKNFIETNIDLIDKEDYHTLFTIWYHLYYDHGKGNDYAALEELFSIFKSIDIDLFSESESARNDIISGLIYDHIDNLLTINPDVEEITFPEVVKLLNSKLSISLLTLNDLFKEAAKELSKTHDIVVLPFRIKRRH